jgi:hypothetical protein
MTPSSEMNSVTTIRPMTSSSVRSVAGTTDRRSQAHRHPAPEASQAGSTPTVSSARKFAEPAKAVLRAAEGELKRRGRLRRDRQLCDVVIVTLAWSAMQSLRPVARDDSRRPGHGLVLRMVCGRCQLRAIGVVVGGEVPVPVFGRLEALDIPVSAVPVMCTRVLAR